MNMKKVTVIDDKVTEIFYPSIVDVFKEIDFVKNHREINWCRDIFGCRRKFHYFNNFDEAEQAFKAGSWNTGIEKLNAAFGAEVKNLEERKRQKMFYDIVGYQASVPRYLQGLPQNMINSKSIQKKEKVVTIVKHIGYLADVTADEIIKNSAKALAILNKIEQMGVRCNLDVYSPASENGTGIIRIRIKNANERLSIGKLAFPLANPDMLRRYVFALRQYNVYDETWNKFGLGQWSIGASEYDIKKNREYLKAVKIDNCIFLNNFIDSPEAELRRNNLIK
jgi:hypothetical protein